MKVVSVVECIPLHDSRPEKKEEKESEDVEPDRTSVSV